MVLANKQKNLGVKAAFLTFIKGPGVEPGMPRGVWLSLCAAAPV